MICCRRGRVEEGQPVDAAVAGLNAGDVGLQPLEGEFFDYRRCARFPDDAFEPPGGCGVDPGACAMPALRVVFIEDAGNAGFEGGAQAVTSVSASHLNTRRAFSAKKPGTASSRMGSAAISARERSHAMVGYSVP